MVESVSVIRQMMADEQFLEAHKRAEVLLTSVDLQLRREVLPLYFQILLQLGKALPPQLILEFARLNFTTCPDDVLNYLNLLPADFSRVHAGTVNLLKIKIADLKGQPQRVYDLINDYQLMLFERNIPKIPADIISLSEKYFRKDFHLGLQRLALVLLAGDWQTAEKHIIDLVFHIVEHGSVKGIEQKLHALFEVLRNAEDKGSLVIYQNLFEFSLHGFKEKRDLKRVAEMMIYFDDFRLQVLLLSLLHKWQLSEIALEYAGGIRKEKSYNFVYISKYYPELKTYFTRKNASPNAISTEQLISEDDLILDEVTSSKEEYQITAVDNENLPEEQHLVSLLKYQDHSFNDLLELAVSFLQSEFHKAALKASSLAKLRCSSDAEFLKASYLELHCLLQLRDYRAALDVAIQGLEKASSRDDILSFMYGEAEALIQLRDKKNARKVLKQIINIDATYRLAKERLERLNEV